MDALMNTHPNFYEWKHLDQNQEPLTAWSPRFCFATFHRQIALLSFIYLFFSTTFCADTCNLILFLGLTLRLQCLLCHR